MDSERSNRTAYIAAAGNNNVVAAGPAVLERLIVGAQASGGSIDVSNDPASGSADVRLHMVDPAPGSYDIGAYFDQGITINLATQTHVTAVWRKA